MFLRQRFKLGATIVVSIRVQCKDVPDDDVRVDRFSGAPRGSADNAHLLSLLSNFKLILIYQVVFTLLYCIIYIYTLFSSNEFMKRLVEYIHNTLTVPCGK